MARNPKKHAGASKDRAPSRGDDRRQEPERSERPASQAAAAGTPSPSEALAKPGPPEKPEANAASGPEGAKAQASPAGAAKDEPGKAGSPPDGGDRAGRPPGGQGPTPPAGPGAPPPSGFRQGLLGGAVVVVVALVLLLLLPQGVRHQLAGSPAAPLEARVATLEQALEGARDLDERLAAVEGRIGELAEAPELAPLESRIAALDAALAALEPAEIPDWAELEQRLARLEDSIAAIEPSVAPELGDLEQRLEARLGERVRALEDELQAGATTADLEHLETRLGDLDARIGELAERALTADALPDAEAVLARVEQEIGVLREELDGRIAEQLSAAAPDLSPLHASIEALEAGQEEQHDRLDRLVGRSDELIGAVSGLRRRMEDFESRLAAADDRAARAVSVTLATARIREALEHGRPFEGPLATLRGLAGVDPAIAAPAEILAAPAAEGVATLAELRRSFRPAASEALHQAVAPEGEGWLEQAADRVLRLVTVRRIDEAEGTSPQAVIARAEHRLEAGDLAGAVAELERLEGAPARALAPWLERARARVAAERALSELDSHAVALLSEAS